jgi:VanZ family protein
VRFLPAALLAVAIFLISGQSRLPTPPLTFEGMDKVVHALVYAFLALLLLLGDGRASSWRAWIWPAVAVLYGFSDEFHQSFVPGRQADALDLLADAAGAVGMTALWIRLRPRQKSLEEST